MEPSAKDYRDLRIAFAGTPEFAAHHLEALLEDSAQIIAVYTQPDRPSGRGKKLRPSPVKMVAESAFLPLYQPRSLRDAHAQDEFRGLDADIFIVVAYGLIIPQAILDIPEYGCINVHASLLPRWRGAAPIHRAVAAGDAETGITIMQMDAGLDTGAILLTTECPIDEDETTGSLQRKLEILGPPTLIGALQGLAANALVPRPQDDALNCYAEKVSKEEARIDWRQDSQTIARLVRAFNPFPVAFSLLGDTSVRIWFAQGRDTAHNERPGTILTSSHNTLEVACGRGTLIIIEAQLPGKKHLPVVDILRGNPELFAKGQRFSP